MCTIDNFQKMKETNELILSLLIEQLLKYGREKSELLKDPSNSAVEINEDRNLIRLSSEEQLKMNKIFTNITQIALNTSDSKQACLQYIKSFQEILALYPKFEKVEMSDSLCNIYELLNKKNDEDLQDVKLGLSNIKTILYKK